jgi:hypothetical protein
MASYRGHLAFAAGLGVVYGGFGLLHWGQVHWGAALLAMGLTTLGGLLPDLDSDSGVPVRELFGIAAAVIPFLIYERLRNTQLTAEQVIVLLAVVYILIRYVLSAIFKRWTVHRGMFHSVPALLIAGLAFFLGYHGSTRFMRVYLAGGVMLGFLSHLLLDELYSVDFTGAHLKLNKYAGTAFKFYSRSWPATVTTYVLLAALGYLAWREWDQLGSG